MEFTSDQNCSFTMSIIGYQFPALENAEYDSNWLNVKIVVSNQQGKWSALEPALLTYEVESLIGWLRTVSAGHYDQRDLSFIEPCISFHLSPAQGNPDTLVVEFSHEFGPPWMANNIHTQTHVAFPLASIDLIAAAESLEKQSRQYPQRAER